MHISPANNIFFLSTSGNIFNGVEFVSECRIIVMKNQGAKGMNCWNLNSFHKVNEEV